MTQAAIPPEAVEDLALALLAIPSVTSDEARIADFVQEWLTQAKFHAVTRAGDNLAFQPRTFREGKPRILLLGHLDTVPVSDPNPARIEGEHIHGLGASDMKCADALLLEVLARAVRDESRFDLAGVLYAAEEGPFEGSGLPEIMTAAPGTFQDIALAIAMEPTDNQLQLGCLGTMHMRVLFCGKRAHSARPWQGKNAIHMAAPLLSTLAKTKPRVVEFHDLKFTESCSATMVEFEGARNVVPGSCTVNLNFRFAPDRDANEAIAWLEDFVTDAVGAAAIASSEVLMEITDICPAGKVCGENPHVQSLLVCATTPMELAAKQAWTDVGRLSAMGIDAVNFGPGHSAQAHQVGEYASRAKLEEALGILEKWLFEEQGG